MKFIYILFLFVSLSVASVSQAQTITVFEEDSTSVLPGSHVFCKNLDNQQVYTFLTDMDGRIDLKTVGKFKRLSVDIYALGFQRLFDTIFSAADKNYYLQHEVTGLNDFVVTAQYAPNNPEKAVHKIKIIDQKKIAAMAAVNLRDVLTNEMMVRIGQDNVLGSSMSLQGISGQNVKILMDGVPVIGRLDGNIDISQINMNNVERIEIVEGPLSVSYGTDALAGTINIITKKNKGGSRFLDADAYYESIGQYNLNLATGIGFKQHSFRLSGGRNYFDGWNPTDGAFYYDAHPVADTTRFKQWKPKEQYFTTFNYGYRLKDLQFNYKFDYFYENVKNRGLPREPYYTTAFDDYYKTNRFDNSISVDGNLNSKFRLNAVVAYNYYRRNKNTYFKDLTTLEEQATTNSGDQDTSVMKTIMSRATVSNFNTASNINYEIGYDAKYEFMGGARIKEAQQSLGDYALFGSLEWKPVKDLIIRPGLRVAYNTGYKAPLIPSLNVKYAIPVSDNGGVFTMRASYARGFRAPSLKELYFDFVDINHDIVGNENLQSENSNNFNVSANFAQSKGSWSSKTEVSGFYNTIHNMISLLQSAPNSTSYTYFNVDNYKTYGVQLQQHIVYKHLKATLGASYIGRYNQLSAEYDMPEFLYSPEIMGNISYELRKEEMSFALFYKYNGPMPGYSLDENDNIVQTRMNAYSWADATISKYLLKRRLNISVGAKNLFNVTSVNGTAAAGPHNVSSNMVPVGIGRSYFAKLTFRFASN